MGGKNKMLLSTETSNLRRRFDDKTAIKMIKDAGFDAFDYSFCYMKDQPEKDILRDDYKERAYRLREYIDETGIVCNQSHAPLDFGLNDETELSNENYLRNVRSIEVAAILGAKNIVVHGIGSVYAAGIDYLEYNTKYLKSYIPYCEKHNMIISIENNGVVDKNRKIAAIPGLFTAQEHMQFVDVLGKDWFNVCVDTGHTAVVGLEPDKLIEGFDNSYLQALHIHENNRLKDQHLLPYGGNFDWDSITAALRKIDYKGDFTLESSSFFLPVPNELLSAALKYAEQVGRNLISKITNQKETT